ncbi:choice-of-anchor tandem repeat GloVer-containing protein [Methyloglobulus sp.]|uniref:choice-of-anchor tandem repeat GloVer-containing protein n=1 Tax=Methyloglobulus sp. TaxID=2518622 RepID=UPI0039890BB5
MLRIKLKFFWKLLVLLELFAFLASFPTVATASKKFEILHTFVGDPLPQIGTIPPIWLIQAKDGNLYGSTFGRLNGPFIPSTLFKIDISKPTPTYSDLNLDVEFGAPNFFHFVQSRNGIFYGTAVEGTFAGPEYLFQINTSVPPPLPTFVTQSLPSSTGDPTFVSELLEGETGVFYATTTFGGNFLEGAGMILQINTANPANFKVLHDFSDDDPPIPLGRKSGLIWGTDGKLYGTTCRSAASENGDLGNGVVFSFDVNGATPASRVLHRFDGIHGTCPQGLLQGRDGKLYGTTDGGGSANQGLIFSLDITRFNPVYRVLHNFHNTVAVHPRGKLVQFLNGKKLYGATASGGRHGKGTVFRLDLSGKKPRYTVIHTFDGIQSGSKPTVIKGRNGNLYGAALEGPGGAGLVYRINLN